MMLHVHRVFLQSGGHGVLRRHQSGQHREALVTTKLCPGSANSSIENPVLPSLSSLLWHCTDAMALSDGKLVHSIIIEREPLQNGYLSNHLLHMYGKCGALDDADALFRNMEEHDAFSWSAMIDAHAQHGHVSMAVSLIRRMHLEGALPNKFTFLSILPVCASPSLISLGKCLHASILAAPLKVDAFLGTFLINMYRKCDTIECAHVVFDNMDNNSRNIVVWTAMASVYTQQDKGQQAMQLFQQMLLEGLIPDKIFYVIIFDGCTSLREVLRMHVYSITIGCDSNVILKNALVNLYAKFGSLHLAWDTFQDISKRTAVSWTTLVSVYTQQGLAREALQFYQQMLLECVVPDNVTFVNVLGACTELEALVEGKRMHVCVLGSVFVSDLGLLNAVLHLYGKAGSLASARRVFENMHKKDLISWNAMIAAYAQHGQVTESFRLFHCMCEKGISPDKVTFISLLEGCAREEALAEGTWVHRFIMDNGVHLDVVIKTAIIDMYAKCGSLNSAGSIFDEMLERDLVTWTAMMAAYTASEQNQSALQLFTQLQMEAMLPNKVTFLTATLACANLADEKEGQRMHVRVVACDAEVDVFVGTALVDLYSKCGKVEEARWFFNNLLSRDAFSWNAMITAYAQHGDGEKALVIFRRMHAHGHLPDEVTLAVILCACNHAGLVDEAFHYFTSLTSNHTIKPIQDHFVRLVDLLARAGQLKEGESLADIYPYQPCGTLWATLLGACSLHVDAHRGERATFHALELAPENAITYVALSNLYAAVEGLVGVMDSGTIGDCLVST